MKYSFQEVARVALRENKSFYYDSNITSANKIRWNLGHLCDHKENKLSSKDLCEYLLSPNNWKLVEKPTLDTTKPGDVWKFCGTDSVFITVQPSTYSPDITYYVQIAGKSCNKPGQIYECYKSPSSKIEIELISLYSLRDCLLSNQ